VSTPTISAAIVTVSADVSAGLADVLTALRTGTQTTAHLRRTSAVLTQAAADIRAIRVDLDDYHPVREQVYDDAAITLALWTWERAQRWNLATLDANIRDGRAVVTELLQGRGLTLHPVRLGETLQSIAARYLGSWQEWRRIADANGIGAGPLTPGTVLTIPSRT